MLQSTYWQYHKTIWKWYCPSEHRKLCSVVEHVFIKCLHNNICLLKYGSLVYFCQYWHILFCHWVGNSDFWMLPSIQGHCASGGSILLWNICNLPLCYVASYSRWLESWKNCWCLYLYFLCKIKCIVQVENYWVLKFLWQCYFLVCLLHQPFLGGAEQTNAISGRLKLGKETLATIEGYWDGSIFIKDRRTGVNTLLCSFEAP